MRQRWSVIPLTLVLFSLTLVTVGSARAGEPSGAGVAPIGVGSIPGRLFADGTVCVVAARDPTRCEQILLKLPDEIVKKRTAYVVTSRDPYREEENFFKIPDEKVPGIRLAFYGIFDLDNDGDPEVYLDHYWPPNNFDCPENYKKDAADDGYAIRLFVYKKVGETYQTYLKLCAESDGYAPGAWFLAEAPMRKAVFMTCYGGSFGWGLFYLDLKKHSLELITDGIFLEHDPVFDDVDQDGVAEIFVEGGGRDRRSTQGAALLHWQEETYHIWWPDWTAQKVIQSTIKVLRSDGTSQDLIESTTYSMPYVIYANLVDLDNDQQKDIIAVLDPEGASYLRELGVWKLAGDVWTLADKVKLPAVSVGDIAYFPKIAKVLPTAHGAEIDLDYSENETLKCVYLDGKLTCSEAKKFLTGGLPISRASRFTKALASRGKGFAFSIVRASQ